MEISDSDSFFFYGGGLAGKHRSLRLIVQPSYLGLLSMFIRIASFKHMIHCMVSWYRFSHSIQFWLETWSSACLWCYSAAFSDLWHLFVIHVSESAASSSKRTCRCRLHDPPRRHLSEGTTESRSLGVRLKPLRLRWIYAAPQTDAACRRIPELRPPCPPGQPVIIKD